jgi:hypothetical protein
MKLLSLVALFVWATVAVRAQETPIWGRVEIALESGKAYENPLYDVGEFSAVFTAPSGRTRKVNGFWDGGRGWKIRFMPDEVGEWQWRTVCSDAGNAGLNSRRGRFACVQSSSTYDLHRRGALHHPAGKYHLAHRDGTPFFWLGCTAWNGALKSTPDEWDRYLQHRRDHGYNVIQLVTTQWRGCDASAEGLVAFTGAGRITLHPEFFRRIDQRMDRVNEYGLVASPVVLWALPSGAGRHLSPGYYLPIHEAVLLAKHIVARYQGHHVVWELGGDGKYIGELEERWKEIGRRTFAGIDHAPATLHPQGRSYAGDRYAAEPWYSLMGYQSSHSTAEGTINWINQGPMARQWSLLRPMPYINMEPVYEQIRNFTDRDVRQASYWSLFATPVAGVTYGANGIWPWLREDGEPILNHGPSPNTQSWANSIGLPGSLQMGYLARFFRQFPWWDLMPANALLAQQPGTADYRRWTSVLSNADQSLILVYVPAAGDVELYNPAGTTFTGQWFDPVNDRHEEAAIARETGRVRATHRFEQDRVLVLRKAAPARVTRRD